MITHPERYVQRFARAGADTLTFHCEAAENPGEVIRLIRAEGIHPGIAINPDIPVKALEPYVESFILSAGSVDIESPTLTKTERVQYAKEQVVSTFKKVFPYILAGVGIGAVIHNWIPESWITSVLGSGNPFGVLLATLVGVPMYADIFGTIPVAEALLAKGAQLGTILSFMMAVTTLSLPSLIMLRKAVKPKLLALFIGVCTVGIILVGYLFNLFQFLFI